VAFAEEPHRRSAAGDTVVAGSPLERDAGGRTEVVRSTR
jgi:hypothetical protein